MAEEAGPAKGLQNLGWCQPGPRASGLGPQEPCYLGRAAWQCVLGALGKSACLAPPGPLPQDLAVTSSLLHISAVPQPGPGEALRPPWVPLPHGQVAFMVLISSLATPWLSGGL